MELYPCTIVRLLWAYNDAKLGCLFLTCANCYEGIFNNRSRCASHIWRSFHSFHVDEKEISLSTMVFVFRRFSSRFIEEHKVFVLARRKKTNDILSSENQVVGCRKSYVVTIFFIPRTFLEGFIISFRPLRTKMQHNLQQTNQWFMNDLGRGNENVSFPTLDSYRTVRNLRRWMEKSESTTYSEICAGCKPRATSW